MQTMTLKRIKNYFNLFMLSSASVLDCEKISLVFLMNTFDEGVGKLAWTACCDTFVGEKLEKGKQPQRFSASALWWTTPAIFRLILSLHPSKTFALKLARFASNEITARNTMMLASVLVSAQTEWYQKAFNSIESLSSYEQMRVYHNPPQPLKSLSPHKIPTTLLL